MNAGRVFRRKVLLAALTPFVLLCDSRAIGLTQVHETEPYRPRVENEDIDYGTMALDLIFGSNYLSWYDGLDDKNGAGSYRVINWVNNGDFYAKKLGSDLHFTAALIQRSTWVTSNAGAMPSEPGLNSIWIDTIFRYAPEGSKWSGALVLSPGASTDFDHFDPRLLRLPVQLSARYAPSKELAFEFGVAYTPDFVRTPVLPLIGFDWTPDDAWEIKARFTSLTVVRKVASRTTVGAFVSYDEASWMIREKADYSQLSYATGTAGVEITQGFDLTDSNPATLSVAAGGTFGGDLSLYNPNGDDLRQSAQLEGGLFLRAGLKIRF